MWIWDQRFTDPRKKEAWSWKALYGLNWLFIVIGFFIMIAGTYGSVIAINSSLNSGNTTSPFSCADNSG